MVCIDCGWKGKKFKLHISGRENGAFQYKAACPNCDSEKINHEYGEKESQLKILVEEE